MNLELMTKMDPIEQFYNAQKSQETKKMYKNYVRYFEDFAGIKLVELLDMDQTDIQNIIIKYIITMKENGLSISSQKGRVAPISSFVQLNDKFLNIKKISKFYEEQETTTEDKAYTLADLKAMLNIAKPRMRVMVLIYSSTGMRKSALLGLKLKHIEKIPEYGLYKFTIYPNSKKYRYTTYCTPECTKEIDNYLEFRRQAGEVITQESYLVRSDFGKFNEEAIKNPKPLTERNINTVFRQLILKANLRNQHEDKSSRREKSLFNAYRKWFNTTLIDADVKDVYKEKFMGHKVGLDENYFRPKDMVAEYAKAIPNLTIGEEERLKVELNQSVQIHKSQYESLKSDFDKLMDVVNELKARKK